MSIFKDKVLMITGGTGSFGNAVLNRFLRTDIGEIRIFSRDEKKQDDMRHEYQAKMPEVAHKIKFYIGDVRNKSTLKTATRGVDYIFHAAALKQVPSCEFFPMEAVKTNVIGTDNVLDVAIDCGVECVICLSTDKADGIVLIAEPGVDFTFCRTAFLIIFPRHCRTLLSFVGRKHRQASRQII